MKGSAACRLRGVPDDGRPHARYVVNMAIENPQHPPGPRSETKCTLMIAEFNLNYSQRSFTRRMCLGTYRFTIGASKKIVVVISIQQKWDQVRMSWKRRRPVKANMYRLGYEKHAWSVPLALPTHQ